MGEVRFWLHWAAHEPFLLRLCLGWVGGNEPEARELLSSAMLKAWEGALKTQEEIGNYRAWLAKIVRHHCIDLQRRQNRDPQIKTDPELLVPISEQNRSTHQASPESTLLKEESYSKLLARLEGLPERLREVMVLRAFQNMSYKEIGQHLKISSENARKRVQLARTLLKGQDDNAHAGNRLQLQQQEQKAADAILLLDRSPTAGGFRFAAPVQFQWQGAELELPVFHAMRPMRLAQKAETLRKYLDRHPGGWKKDLELARLCWAMGEAAEALELARVAFERQPHIPELALGYIRILQALGAIVQLHAVVQQAREECQSGPFADLLSGFEARAAGDDRRAEELWRATSAIGGGLQLARLYLEIGNKAAAVEVLQAHLRAHPMDREAFYWMGIAAAGSAEGLQHALTAQRRFPGDLFAASRLMAEQWRLADSEAAPAFRASVLELTKQCPESYLAMALRAAWSHRFGFDDNAALIAGEFLALHPRHVQGLQFAVALATLQGKMDLASLWKCRLEELGNDGSFPAVALDHGTALLGSADFPKFTF